MASLCPTRDNNPGLVGDCEILLGAKDTLEGRGRSGLNWNANRAMADWNGVTLDGTPSRVTRVNLRDRGLRGSIPAELGNLTALQVLDLSDNRLTGSIPEQLGDLSDLTVLWLYDNQLSGEIPSELSSLSNLNWLVLSGNRLTGEIPAELGEMTTLTRLWLQDNQLSGEIPPEIGGLTRMRILRMHNNGLNGPIPWQLESLTRLFILHLSGNPLEGCVPPSLRDVGDNDFDTLGLPYCTEGGRVPTPEGLSATLTDGAFTATWTPVTGAGKYEVQHRIQGPGDEWTALPSTDSPSSTHSPIGGAVCETIYEFRVRAYGDGAAYAAGWSEPSAEVAVSTGPCNQPPEFDSSSYAFPVWEYETVGTVVGSVSATDPDEGDTVSYSITLGNGEGKFTIDESTGTITVAAALDYENTPSYELTVEADDGNGGKDTTTVTITVRDIVEGELELWSGTMTAGPFTLGYFSAYGYTMGVMVRDTHTGGAHGTLDNTAFIYGGETYTVELATYVAGASNLQIFFIGLDERHLPTDTDMVLYVDDHRLEGWATGDVSSADTMYYYITDIGFALTEGQEVALSLRKPTPPTTRGWGPWL